MVKQALRPAAPPKASPKARQRAKPQTAALPPDRSKIRAGGSLRLKFGAGSAKLNADATRKLKSVAEAMSEDAKLRLQLLAYAGGSSQGASRARRLSLSRALSARSFLIGAGVRSTRIDVRALGNKSDGGPPDRIDVIVTKR
jgi:outer membrane protein OmpA-like peptidoglycan-associated protein